MKLNLCGIGLYWGHEVGLGLNMLRAPIGLVVRIYGLSIGRLGVFWGAQHPNPTIRVADDDHDWLD